MQTATSVPLDCLPHEVDAPALRTQGLDYVRCPDTRHHVLSGLTARLLRLTSFTNRVNKDAWHNFKGEITPATLNDVAFPLVHTSLGFSNKVTLRKRFKQQEKSMVSQFWRPVSPPRLADGRPPPVFMSASLFASLCPNFSFS